MYGFEAVKVGFSWPALFFGILWMMYKKLWLFAGIIITLFFLLSLIETVIIQSQNSGIQVTINLFLIIFYFVLWFLPAFKGNKWRENNLSNFKARDKFEFYSSSNRSGRVVCPLAKR